MNERILPTIDTLSEELDGTGEGDKIDYFIVQRVQAYATLLIALELEQINNNLEALRQGDRS